MPRDRMKLPMTLGVLSFGLLVVGCAQPLPVFDSTLPDTTRVSSLDADGALALCGEIAAFYARSDAVRGNDDICLSVVYAAADETACNENYARCRAGALVYLCDAHTVPVDSTLCDGVTVSALEAAVMLVARLEITRTARELCALPLIERGVPGVGSPDATTRAAFDCMLNTSLNARASITR